MKKNILLIVAIAVVGTMTLTFSTLRAQNDTPPVAPPAGQVPPQRPPPRGRPNMGYQQVIFMLKRAKINLEHSNDDYNGHRQSAMDACDKAVQELEAVQASIMAAAKAAAAAAVPPPGAQQAPPPTSPAPPQ
jgi:hypothetical protein